MGCQYCGREDEDNLETSRTCSAIMLEDGSVLVSPVVEESLFCETCGVHSQHLTFEEEYVAEDL